RRRRLAVAAVVGSLVVALGASSAGWWWTRQSERQALVARLDAEATTAFLTELLLAPDVTEQGPAVRVVDVLDSARALAEEDLRDRPEVRGRILWLIGRVRGALGKGEKAEALELLALAESAFAEVPGDGGALRGAQVTLARARLQVEIGRLDAAADTLASVEPALSRASPSSEVWALRLRTQGLLRSERGDLAGAEAAYRRVIEADRPVDEQTVKARGDLAAVLERRGRLEEAEPLYRRNLASNLEQHGQRHERTITVRHNLAGLLAQLGRFEEAEALFRANVGTVSPWLGKEHRLYVMSLGALANVLGDQGRLEAAADLDREVLPLAEGVWGEDHPRTQIRRMNAANRSLISGDLEAAEALLTPAVAHLGARLGDAAGPTLYARMLLIQLWLDSGRAPQAAELAESSRTAALSGLGPDSPVTLAISARLGLAWIQTGRGDDGLALLRGALEGQWRVLGETSVDVVESQIALAEAEGRVGNGMAKRRLLCALEASLSRDLGAEHPRRLDAAERLADAGGCPR
ncbi:MAG: tetratricopeptide repeat protein, partial [Acidobacteriota bacterium]